MRDMQQFIKFGLVGALSTLIDIIVFRGLLFVHAPLFLSVAVGFFAGFSNGYYFNSHYVFGKKSKVQYRRYFTVSALGFVLTELIVHFVHFQVGFTEIQAKLVAVVIVFFCNFFLSKFWAFQ